MCETFNLKYVSYLSFSNVQLSQAYRTTITINARIAGGGGVGEVEPPYVDLVTN